MQVCVGERERERLEANVYPDPDVYTCVNPGM